MDREQSRAHSACHGLRWHEVRLRDCSNADLFLLREVRASSCPQKVDPRRGLSTGHGAPYQYTACKDDGKASQDRPVERPPRRNWNAIHKGARKREEPLEKNVQLPSKGDAKNPFGTHPTIGRKVDRPDFGA